MVKEYTNTCYIGIYFFVDDQVHKVHGFNYNQFYSSFNIPSWATPIFGISHI